MPEKYANELFVANLTESSTVGRYEILRKLGQGSTGVVFQARDPYINRQVALKVAPRTSATVKETFFMEVQSAGALSHANIVAVYDAGVLRDFCYIAMEYVDGPKLDGFCEKDSLLPISNVADIIYRACLALEYAHGHGVIHRDIKPSNILLEKGIIPKISDFGVAQMADRTAPLGVFGTPSYMSPEQLQDEPTGPQTDIYSLGCVLYELLTGQKAFEGQNYFAIMNKVINTDPVPVTRINPDIPPIFERILQKAMARDQVRRYRHSGEMAYDLRVALRGLASPIKPGKIKDVIDYVLSVSFFNGFSKTHVKELLAASELVQAKKGEILVAQGDIDDSFYIVLSGACKVMRNNRKVASIATGECFGEMAYIGGQPRSATVIAETECVLMKINGVLLDRAPATIQLLFYKKFALALVARLSGHGKKPEAI